MRKCLSISFLTAAALALPPAAAPAGAGLEAFLQPAFEYDRTPESNAAPAASPAVTSVAATSRGEVARAAFTTAVIGREPADQVTRLGDEADKVYYFTELANMDGRTVVHRWEFNGRVVAEVPFEVRGPRWRVYSYKSLHPGVSGEWTAATVDENGRVLTLNTLEYRG